MTTREVSVGAQLKGWAGLKGLRPSPIDLERVSLLRSASLDDLRDLGRLEQRLARLGLNDERPHEWPTSLTPFLGQGLRLWQYPTQFAAYLRTLAELRVESYVELGIRHGGSFVTTVEYLQRFHPMSFAVGVDLIPCPAMDDYKALQPISEFACVNSESPAFDALLDRLGPIDLVFIDSHHQEAQCRRELRKLGEHAQLLALHDISNADCPGVRVVWDELKATGAYDCHEFCMQYTSAGPFMGIGLAVNKNRKKASP